MNKVQQIQRSTNCGIDCHSLPVDILQIYDETFSIVRSLNNYRFLKYIDCTFIFHKVLRKFGSTWHFRHFQCSYIHSRLARPRRSDYTPRVCSSRFLVATSARNDLPNFRRSNAPDLGSHLHDLFALIVQHYPRIVNVRAFLQEIVVRSAGGRVTIARLVVTIVINVLCARRV